MSLGTGSFRIWLEELEAFPLDNNSLDDFDPEQDVSDEEPSLRGEGEVESGSEDGRRTRSGQGGKRRGSIEGDPSGDENSDALSDSSEDLQLRCYSEEEEERGEQRGEQKRGKERVGNCARQRRRTSLSPRSKLHSPMQQVMASHFAVTSRSENDEVSAVGIMDHLTDSSPNVNLSAPVIDALSFSGNQIQGSKVEKEQGFEETSSPLEPSVRRIKHHSPSLSFSTFLFPPSVSESPASTAAPPSPPSKPQDAAPEQRSPVTRRLLRNAMINQHEYKAFIQSRFEHSNVLPGSNAHLLAGLPYRSRSQRQQEQEYSTHDVGHAASVEASIANPTAMKSSKSSGNLTAENCAPSNLGVARSPSDSLPVALEAFKRNRSLRERLGLDKLDIQLPEESSSIKRAAGLAATSTGAGNSMPARDEASAEAAVREPCRECLFLLEEPSKHSVFYLRRGREQFKVSIDLSSDGAISFPEVNCCILRSKFLGVHRRASIAATTPLTARSNSTPVTTSSTSSSSLFSTPRFENLDSCTSIDSSSAASFQSASPTASPAERAVPPSASSAKSDGRSTENGRGPNTAFRVSPKSHTGFSRFFESYYWSPTGTHSGSSSRSGSPKARNSRSSSASPDSSISPAGSPQKSRSGALTRDATRGGSPSRFRWSLHKSPSGAVKQCPPARPTTNGRGSSSPARKRGSRYHVSNRLSRDSSSAESEGPERDLTSSDREEESKTARRVHSLKDLSNRDSPDVNRRLSKQVSCGKGVSGSGALKVKTLEAALRAPRPRSPSGVAARSATDLPRPRSDERRTILLRNMFQRNAEAPTAWSKNPECEGTSSPPSLYWTRVLLPLDLASGTCVHVSKPDGDKSSSNEFLPVCFPLPESEVLDILSQGNGGVELLSVETNIAGYELIRQRLLHWQQADKNALRQRVRAAGARGGLSPLSPAPAKALSADPEDEEEEQPSGETDRGAEISSASSMRISFSLGRASEGEREGSSASVLLPSNVNYYKVYREEDGAQVKAAHDNRQGRETGSFNTGPAHSTALPEVVGTSEAGGSSFSSSPADLPSPGTTETVPRLAGTAAGGVAGLTVTMPETPASLPAEDGAPASPSDLLRHFQPHSNSSSTSSVHVAFPNFILQRLHEEQRKLEEEKEKLRREKREREGGVGGGAAATSSLSRKSNLSLFSSLLSSSISRTQSSRLSALGSARGSARDTDRLEEERERVGYSDSEGEDEEDGERRLDQVRKSLSERSSEGIEMRSKINSTSSSIRLEEGCLSSVAIDDAREGEAGAEEGDGGRGKKGRDRSTAVASAVLRDLSSSSSASHVTSSHASSSLPLSSSLGSSAPSSSRPRVVASRVVSDVEFDPSICLPLPLPVRKLKQSGSGGATLGSMPKSSSQ